MHPFPGGSVIKDLPANAGDTGDSGSIPGLERFPWRRKWQSISVFLPGKSHGQRSPVGYSWWGHKESDMTEHARTHFECTTPVSPVKLSFLPLPLGFPVGTCAKDSTCQCGRRKKRGLIPGVGTGTPLQYSCLENSCQGRGAWWATGHGIAESDETEYRHSSLPLLQLINAT